MLTNLRATFFITWYLFFGSCSTNTAFVALIETER